MKKVLLLVATVSVLATSCKSKKEYTDLQDQKKKVQTQLNNSNRELSTAKVQLSNCDAELQALKDKIAFLERGNEKLLINVDNLIAVSKSGNESMKSALTQLGKKDEYINKLRDLQSKKDSINLVVAFNLKKVLPQGLNDEDITINIDGTKVFISIADKLLFKSGSYRLSKVSDNILNKVAKVVNEYPEMDVMVEGHTDDKSVVKGASFKDNWELSVQRATSVVRALQNKYDVKAERLIAAGRSQYAPIAENDSSANRSKNRRTKIVILPKMDEFFDLLEAQK